MDYALLQAGISSWSIVHDVGLLRLIWTMAEFNITTFTQNIAALYAKRLTAQLPKVTCRMDEAGAIAHAMNNERLFRIVRPFGPSITSLSLDEWKRSDGSIKEEQVVDMFADFFVDQVL